jgi:hypothetical protein
VSKTKARIFDMARRITILEVSAHCSDLCSVVASNADGDTIQAGDGYVPDFMPGQHYGDAVTLKIDVATGKILNWKAPTDAQIMRDLEGM